MVLYDSFESFHSIKTLIMLDLSENQIGDNGIWRLSRALQHNTVKTKFSCLLMQKCFVSFGNQGIGESLSRHSQLSISSIIKSVV